MAQINVDVNVASTTHMLLSSLFAGGVAGTSVDVILFPLDTIKTRLQSEKGFIKSGGFSGIYKGILPVLIGSAPTAALFFLTYESCKFVAQPVIAEKYNCFVHMGASSLGEVVACLIRVPVETVKQRKQVQIVETKYPDLKLLYRGFWSTVLRDMPFSLIQFPLWEYLKTAWSTYTQKDILPTESATCGAMAGAIAAIATTPLDVVKTRTMLADHTVSKSELKIWYMLKQIYKDEGLFRLFSGVIPRTLWITLGGFVFFGTYEMAKQMMLLISDKKEDKN